MRRILTHNSKNAEEIVECIMRSNSFTAPLGLPHYRYDNTRRNCYKLEDAKIIKRVGTSDIHVHFGKGENTQRWIDAGKPPLIAFCNIIAKEVKAANPKKPKVKTCRGCGIKFETINYAQKSCKKGCIAKESNTL